MRARCLALTVVVFAATACGGHQHNVAPPPATATVAATSSIFRGAEVQPYAAPQFALRDQDGKLVSLRSKRGDVVLVTFLYTRCPDVCPLIASKLNAALRLLPAPERAKTSVLAVSVDPEHDTAAAIRHFVAEHELVPQFRYLTASRAKLKPIWQAYNVLATPRSGEAIDHTAYVAVVDRTGTVRAYFDSTAQPTAVAHDVRLLLS